MVENKILYLSRKDVEQTDLDFPTILNLLEHAFRVRAQGEVEMPPKIGVHTRPDAFLHAMPAYIPALSSTGVKWVGAYPDNYRYNLPYITGLLILNDPSTGLPYAIMDCSWITAHRTGAATALSARYLARKNSEVVGIIACGLEGRTNLLALAEIFNIRRVYAYDISEEAQNRYILEMSTKLGIEIIGVGQPRDAVVDSDIVITAGPISKHPKPTILKEWLKPGVFASSVDFGSYWTPECLANFDKFVTDDLPQYNYYKSVGYFDGFPEPHSDLVSLVSGTFSGRERTDECTMAMNLGLAIEDLAIAPEIYRRAVERGLGVLLAL